MLKKDRQTDYRALAEPPAHAPSPAPSPAPLHQRQGDRGDPDDAAALPTYVRFKDLVAAHIVGNWPTLIRLIDEENFPAGVMLGKNTRAWRADEVLAWIGSRPAARKEIPPSVIEAAVAGRAAARAKAKAETAS
jgi:predicted DNA-binding transcriptional regulator AlpA